MAATRTQVATYLNEDQLKYWEAVKRKNKDATDAELLRQLIIDAGKKAMAGDDVSLEDRVSDLESRLEELERMIRGK